MQKTERYDLTSGSILQKLLMLSLPIMGTQLMQMAYNLTDMFWLGRLGSGAVAASGTVGNYMWLAAALMHYGDRGGEIGVSQSIGAGDRKAAQGYGRDAMAMALVLGLFFGAFLFVFAHPLVGFFNIQEAQVVADSITYLRIVAVGVPFTYIGAAAGICFSGSGNSLTPFIINGFCLVLNMVLDPVLIFPMGLGVAGAGYATIIAQAVSCLLLVAALKHYRHPIFAGFKLLVRPAWHRVRNIIKWGTPIVVESFFFTFLMMICSRFVAAFGAGAIASQRIGTQVENLSWLVAGGFGSAFTAYVGQNYGGGKWRRIHRGFGVSTAVMGVWGLLVTGILYFGAEGIFTAFLPGEPEVVEIGVMYIWALAVCQIPQCLEPIAAGAFRGIGRTVPPSLTSIACNIVRVGLCWWWGDIWGLDGLWWALAVGAALRGVVTYLCYLVAMPRLPKKDVSPETTAKQAM